MHFLFFFANVWSGCESTVTNTRLVKPSQVLRGRRIADGYVKLQLVWRQKNSDASLCCQEKVQVIK